MFVGFITVFGKSGHMWCCAAVWGPRPGEGLPFFWCGDGGMKSSASTASLDSERLPPIASKRKPGEKAGMDVFFFFRRWAPGHG